MDPHEVCKGLLRRDLCGECQQRENHQGDNVSDRCGRDVIAGRHKHRPLHRDVCKWHQAWQGSRDIFGSPFSRHHPSWWGRAGRHPLHERCDFGTCRGHGLDPWGPYDIADGTSCCWPCGFGCRLGCVQAGTKCAHEQGAAAGCHSRGTTYEANFVLYAWQGHT